MIGPDYSHYWLLRKVQSNAEKQTESAVKYEQQNLFYN